MHELQATHRNFDIVLRHAQANGANKAGSIRLKIGELSNLENEWIQKYFDHIRKGTFGTSPHGTREVSHDTATHNT